MLLPIKKAERIRATVGALSALVGLILAFLIVDMVNIANESISSGLGILVFVGMITIGTRLSKKIFLMECPKCGGVAHTKEFKKTQSSSWTKRKTTYGCDSCDFIKKEVTKNVGGDIS